MLDTESQLTLFCDCIRSRFRSWPHLYPVDRSPSRFAIHSLYTACSELHRAGLITG
jgi:hypothetical protein